MRDLVRSSRLAIHDMLDTIEQARIAAVGLTLEEFRESTLNRFAVERAIEIISEAARKISDDLTASEPGIPWQKVRGIGNVLRHDYRDIAPEVIFNVIEKDLGPLEAALRRMLARIGEE